MHHLFLCDEQPPFLHLNLMRNLVAEGMCTGDWRTLEKEVSGVFSNLEALNRSFLMGDAARQAAATRLQASGARHSNSTKHGSARVLVPNTACRAARVGRLPDRLQTRG